MTCDSCCTCDATNVAARPRSDRLIRREREILNAIFALGNKASAEDVRGRLTDPPSESAVRVMLTRLEKKGVVHQVDGLRYLYSATAPDAVAKKTARQYLQTFFRGSLARMMTSLVAEGILGR